MTKAATWSASTGPRLPLLMKRLSSARWTHGLLMNGVFSSDVPRGRAYEFGQLINSEEMFCSMVESLELVSRLTDVNGTIHLLDTDR